MAEKTLRWGLLATGAIAKTFARGLAGSRTGKLVAVGSRTQEGADKFGEEFKVPKRYGSYEGVLEDPEVEAVYISPPHPMHAEWAIRAAEAGKHILCEKPLGMNASEAMAIIEAAAENDVFLMEAFMYRCHPQTARLVELLRERVIGDVRVIQATFSFRCGWNPESRLLKNALGGGGILDVGCYCASLSRLVAGVAMGGTIAEPVEVKGVGHIGESRIDDYASAVLRFPGDIIAQISTGVQVGQENVVRIFGTEGNIFIPSPWIPGQSVKIIAHRYGEEKPREMVIESDRGLYSLEADVVAENIEKRQAPFPAMSWDDTLGNMRTLDRWRASFGFTYDCEQPEAFVLTAAKRKLKTRPDARIPKGNIPGIGKPVSRLVMGVDNQTAMPHTAVMFDHFFENGGNCFDTAHIYGGGNCERVLGRWVRNHNIRDQVVILDKGAHTPWCNPADLTKQLHESLERLGMEYVDLYMMHRDNTDIPAGEFIDVMNEHQSAGRMRAFGVSNWTLERIKQANEYAKKNNKTPFAAISNQFSLARMLDAVWSGCLSASDDAFRVWLKETQTPLMPWSSQARGFFTDLARPEDRSNAELVRCWYADDNFQRQARAKELAQKRGVLPIHIALAYVLCQPFPTFPLIGPRQLSETWSSMKALEIQLSPEELKWLNLED